MSLNSLITAGAVAALTAIPATAQAPAPFSLSWPVDCRLGQSCEIQRYIDHDPGSGAKDYTCGTRTNDGHEGLDIRLPDMAAQRRGVAVLAAADGQVLRIREGVEDVSVRVAGPESVDGVGCGNAVVIAHAGGFQTAYCHMAKASLRVKAGQTVKAGEPIGRIGLSGLTEFPHLHFMVSERGKRVDPFAYGQVEGACGGGRSLWRETPPYLARVVINAGFAAAPVTIASLEDGGLAPPRTDTALIAYVRAVGLQPGDVKRLSLRGPDGAVLADSRSDKVFSAQDLSFTGRARAPAGGWPKGRYEAGFTLTRDGRTLLTKSFALVL